MFTEFDDYLNLDFLVDYWYDEGVGIASAMLSNFDAADWSELAKQCSSRTHAWQVRCAEVLDSVDHPTSEDILVGLLSSRSDDVVVAAADSLRLKHDVRLSTESIERLKNMSLQASAPVKVVLENFLSRIGPT